MNSEFHHENDLTVSDICKVFKANKLSIIISPLSFAVIALTLSWLFITPSYEAVGNIEIGQVAGKPIDNALVLEQKLNDKSFLLDVVVEHPEVFNHEKDFAIEDDRLLKAVTFKKLKDVEIVSFSLRSQSADSAYIKSNAVLDSLQHKHEINFYKEIAIVRKKIEMINAQLASLRNDSQKLQRNISISQGLNNFASVIESLTLKDNSEALRALEERKFELESSLDSVKTYNTKLLGKIYVSKVPVSPNLPLIGFIAFLVGLFFAVFFALLRDSLARKST